MRKLLYSLAIVFIAISFIGCQKELTPKNLKAWKQNCFQKRQSNPNDKFIFSGGECLQYYLAKGKQTDSVIVFLPGSHTKGGHALNWATKYADQISTETNIDTYVINMPGYGKSSKNRFNKMLWNPGDIPTANIDFINFTIELLKKIKQKHNAKNLYVIGHSSGATLAAVISGYKPNLIQKAICVAGTYDFDTRVKNWKKWSMYSYVSAINYVKNIGNTDIILLIGENDKEARKLQTKIFEKALKDNNKKVKVISYPNVSHRMSYDMWEDIPAYIKE